MIQRVIQFWRAVNASLNDEDYVFIRQYLNKREQRLFFNMNLFDQRHVLNVAYTAEKLCRQTDIHVAVNRKLLLRACLLHDIARTKDVICLWDKVICVLLAHFFPHSAEKYCMTHRFNNMSFWQKRRYALYIYYHHAQIGAALLSQMGLDEIASIVARHHSPRQIDDSEELNILRQADSLN